MAIGNLSSQSMHTRGAAEMPLRRRQLVFASSPQPSLDRPVPAVVEDDAAITRALTSRSFKRQVRNPHLAFRDVLRLRGGVDAEKLVFMNSISGEEEGGEEEISRYLWQG